MLTTRWPCGYSRDRRTCAARGYDLLTSFQQLSSDWHVDYEDSRKADGIILLGYGNFEQYRCRLDQLIAQGTHFVRWGSAAPDAGVGLTIGCDNRRGGRDAGRHLTVRGRRRVAFLGDISDRYPEFRDRYRGLRDALTEAGLTFDPALQVGALLSEESGVEAARRLIARGAPFDAIFAASDLIAVGVLRVLAEAGLRAPDDVSVIGFDDIPAAAMSVPPLTTIAQDYRRAGELLVDTLIQRIRDQPTGHLLLPPQLVVRQSS